MKTTSWLASAAESAHKIAERHPRKISAGLLLSLAGFAATAFGVASTGVPDPADLPQRVVSETVQPLSIEQQLEALAAHDLELNRSDLTRSSDSPATLLRRLGVNDDDAAAFLRQDPVARLLLQGRPGKMVTARARGDGRLVELVARYPAEDSTQAATHFTRLTLRQQDSRWVALRQTAPLAAEVRLGSGTIRNSLYGATDEAGLPDPIAAQLAEMFAGDIDFHRELRKGDTFSVVYEALTADGEPINWNQGAGRLLAAEFVNGGRSHQAMWMKEASGHGGEFVGLDGKSRRRAFLASPMEFSRVTSGFAMRFHPIHQELRAHKGVDYGAPVGTPVRSVGDGTVKFAGWQNGYGNVVEVQHAEDRTTLYAHLSRIDVRKGERIEQGRRIGAVGATGWATGPHLHFEFRVKGVHQDPLQFARAAQTQPVSAQSRAEFQQLASAARAQLATARSVGGITSE